MNNNLKVLSQRILSAYGEAPKQINPFEEIANKCNESFQKGLVTESEFNSAIDYFEDLMKGMGHKYFKREGTAGNYKYYYTEAEYKKAKGGKEESSKVANPSEGISGDSISSEVKSKLLSNLSDNQSKNSMRGMMDGDKYSFSIQTGQFGKDKLVVYNSETKSVSYSGDGSELEGLDKDSGIPHLGYESKFAQEKVESKKTDSKEEEEKQLNDDEAKVPGYGTFRARKLQSGLYAIEKKGQQGKWSLVYGNVHLGNEGQTQEQLLTKYFDAANPKISAAIRGEKSSVKKEDKGSEKKDSLEENISTNSEGIHQFINPVNGKVVSESKSGESKKDFIDRIKSNTEKQESKKPELKSSDIRQVLASKEGREYIEGIEGLDSKRKDHLPLYLDYVEKLKSKFGYDYKDKEWDKAISESEDKKHPLQFLSDIARQNSKKLLYEEVNKQFGTKFKIGDIEEFEDSEMRKQLTGEDIQSIVDAESENDVEKSEQPSPYDILKSDITYAFDNYENPLEITKKGSLIKSMAEGKLPLLQEDLMKTKMLCEAIKLKLQEQGVIIDEEKEFLNEMESESDIIKEDLRKYYHLKWKQKDIQSDIDTLQIVIEGIDENKSYKLTVRQIKSLK